MVRKNLSPTYLEKNNVSSSCPQSMNWKRELKNSAEDSGFEPVTSEITVPFSTKIP